MVQFRNAATLRSFQTNKWLYYAKRRWRLLAVVLVVTNLLFLPNPMSQVPQKMGSTISGQSSPDSASPLAWSNNLLLEKHEECPATTEQQRDRVVLIRTYLQFWTGGTEALVQLAVAFQSWMPSHTFIEIATQFKRDPHRPCRWYPTFCDISEKSTDDLRPGDIYIVPEIFECPVDLVERGVQVYVWLLAGPPERLEWRQLQREGGCHFLSHNQCLARHLEFQLPRHQILLPYITKSYNGTIHNHRRENLILINTHDSLDSPEIEGIRDYCKSTNCTMLLAKGFNREQLVDLYERAKIIIAFCMVGCERTPIEAVLRGEWATCLG